jgi:hypothetical protein
MMDVGLPGYIPTLNLPDGAKVCEVLAQPTIESAKKKLAI